MALSIHQVQRQTQRLIMTPQMQQSIQLLQMNSMDLEQLIYREMAENPFLELTDDEEGLQTAAAGTESEADFGEAPPDSGLSDQAGGAGPVEYDEPQTSESSTPWTAEPLDGIEAPAFEDSYVPPSQEASIEEPGLFSKVDVDWEQEYGDSDTAAYQAPVDQDEEENDFTTYTAKGESLYDSLTRQLQLSSLEGRDREIGEFLIGNVDEDGFIDCSGENLCLMLKYPVELVRPEMAGSVEHVDRRLRKLLGNLHGGQNPDAYMGMKRRELILRCTSAILGQTFDETLAMKRDLWLRRLVAVRMKQPRTAFDTTTNEELLLEVVAYRLRTSPEVVYDVLEILHEFEPTGVCARSLAECLKLQCEELGIRNRVLYRVLEEHLSELQQKKFKEIARALGTTEDAIKEVFHIVSRLEPKPGRSTTNDKARYIRPDVYVKKVDEKYLYYLNEGDVGKLTVSNSYRQLIKSGRRGAAKPGAPVEASVETDDVSTAVSSMPMETVESSGQPTMSPSFLQEKHRNAVWLIKNIEKRKTTILRVTEAIMNYQKAFLEKGIEHLRPLTLRDIAEVVGMHESTIARVTTNKYVETPRGIFELKYFFSSGLETDEGDHAASRAIKEMLTQLIAAEDTNHPLSDQKIADLLKARGINIARRTVAKYREQLKILPAKLRRDVAK